MTQPETVGALWLLIEESNRQTREGVTQALAEVRARLGEMVTKEVWDAERRELERRMDRAELELAQQDHRQQALQDRLDTADRAAAASQEQAARAAQETIRLANEERSRRRRDLFYKGFLPVLGLIITALGLFMSLH